MIVGLLLVVGLAVTWVALRNRQASSETAENTSTREGTQSARRGGSLHTSEALAGGDSSQTATSAVRRATRSWTAENLVDCDNLSDTDKQLILDLQNALDDNDLNGVTAAARKLMHSESVPARVRTATALSWFGTTALPEMVEMLNDPSEEVFDTILTATLDAIAEMEDGPEKAELLAAIIETLKDIDAIEEALMHFLGTDDEIVTKHLNALIANAQGNPQKQAVLNDFLKFVSGDSFL